MWIDQSCWINFYYFFGIVNLVIFHPEYIDSEWVLVVSATPLTVLYQLF